MLIYLDHNIIDDLSKGSYSLNGPEGVEWIYSNEHFKEIERAGDNRFFHVLREMKAKKLELILNERFQMTEEAQLLDSVDPEILFNDWLQANAEVHVDEQMYHDLLGRIFGADNRNAIDLYPDRFRNQIALLLEPHGAYHEEIREQVEGIALELETVVADTLRNVPDLEESRQGMGTHKGRASNLQDRENPLEEIWKLIQPSCPASNADQFFGFEPIDKQGYDELPLYLGIVACHTVLNLLGYRPDKGLAKVEGIPGILSDGSHIAYASYCDVLLSRDIKLCAKARAIYRYKYINTQVPVFQISGIGA